MSRIGCLNDDSPLLPSSSGPATHLFHELKSTLIYPEISEAQQTICIQDAHQGNMLKVQPFDLKPHTQVNTARFEVKP